MDAVNIKMECRLLLRSPEEVEAEKAQQHETTESEESEDG